VTPEGPNHFSVINAGIGGNKLLTDARPNNLAYGINALARADRDVFGHAGVSYVILYEGINDLGGRDTTADDLIASMKQIIERAHERGIKVIVSTITPSGARAPIDPANLSPADQRRAAVNEWVRTNKESDGFIDFYKAVAEPDKPGMILAAFDSGDRLHPNEDGLRAMANSIDLSLFQSPGTASAAAGPAPLAKSKASAGGARKK
jgi:lysophospholipase L1-like esterase